MSSRPLMRRGWRMLLCVALTFAAGWWTYRGIGPESRVALPEQAPVEALSGSEGEVSGTLSLIRIKPAAMKALPSVHEVDARQKSLLPDAQLALADQIEWLVPLARDGNPTAICRLHLAAARCRTVGKRVERARREQRDLEQRLDGLAEISDRTWLLAQARASLTREQATLAWCKGVDLEALPDTQGMSEKALAGMSTWQRVLLVMTRPDGTLMRLWQHPMLPESHASTAGYLYPQFLSDHAYFRSCRQDWPRPIPWPWRV